MLPGGLEYDVDFWIRGEKGYGKSQTLPWNRERFQERYRTPLPNILPSSNPLSFRVGDLREKTNNIKVTQNDSK